MVYKKELETKNFDYRLFLDDYLIDSKYEDRSSKFCKNSSPFEGSYISSPSPKIYYNELEELGTFCCLDEGHSYKGSACNHKLGSFSLLNFLPKCDSIVFDDFTAIISREKSYQIFNSNELLSIIQTRHTDRLRQKLISLTDGADNCGSSLVFDL